MHIPHPLNNKWKTFSKPFEEVSRHGEEGCESEAVLAKGEHREHHFTLCSWVGPKHTAAVCGLHTPISVRSCKLQNWEVLEHVTFREWDEKGWKEILFHKVIIVNSRWNEPDIFSGYLCQKQQEQICETCVNCSLVMKCCKVPENNGDEISESIFYLFL